MRRCANPLTSLEGGTTSCGGPTSSTRAVIRLPSSLLCRSGLDGALPLAHLLGLRRERVLLVFDLVGHRGGLLELELPAGLVALRDDLVEPVPERRELRLELRELDVPGEMLEGLLDRPVAAICLRLRGSLRRRAGGGFGGRSGRTARRVPPLDLRAEARPEALLGLQLDA